METKIYRCSFRAVFVVGGGAHGSCGFELHQNTGGVNILMLSFSLGLVFGLVFFFVQGAYC